MSNKQNNRKPISNTSDQNANPVGMMKRKLARQCWIAIIISQAAIIIIAAIIYTALSGIGSDTAFMLTMTLLVVGEVTTIYSVIELLIYPIDVVARSYNNVTGEKPVVYPPNPNSLHGPVKAELQKLVGYIYNQNQTSLVNDHSPTTDAGQTALSLINSLPVGIIAIDRYFNIIAFNDRAPVYQAGNQRLVQLDFTNSSQSLAQWFEKVSHSSVTATQTWTRVQNVPSGSLVERHVYDVVASYSQQSANDISLIVVTIDRTADYVDSEDNIDFVALAAHELRGPITVIRGYLDMLDEEIYDKSTQEQKDLLDRLNVSARRLASYVNNVLNANRYDRRHLKLKLRETSIADIIGDVRTDLDLRANTVNRHIEWQIPDKLPTVAADRSSISEVVTNLVDNAIKYSSSNGQIEVVAKPVGDFVAVSIVDHGIGIAQSAMDQLFTKFYRSHRSSASVGGTGIGLYISRAIVESHGGKIGVDSTEGEGSTFTFTLPTYASVKDKLDEQNNSNVQLISQKGSQIRNHGSIKE